jgi:anti-sigma B factor antagonist
MAAQQGTVRFCDAEQTLLLQIEGWGTMKQSLPLRRFVEEHLAGPTTRVAVDLRGCTYIDSTFLGTLLYLHRAVARRQGGDFRLISPSPECTRLLQQMGVTDVFHVSPGDEAAPPAWKPLLEDPRDKQCFQRNVIEAHEQLASLPGAAGEPFRAVVRCLAKDAKREEGGDRR